jgi:hypothetical protein
MVKLFDLVGTKAQQHSNEHTNSRTRSVDFRSLPVMFSSAARSLFVRGTLATYILMPLDRFLPHARKFIR